MQISYIQLWSRALRTPWFHAWFWTSIFQNAAAWLLVAIYIAPLRSERDSFVLHATVYFGIDRLGPWTGTLIPAAVGLAVLLTNTLFALFLLPRHRPLAHLVGAVTVFVEAFSALATFELVRLNTL